VVALRRPYAGESPRTTLATTARDHAAGPRAGTDEAFGQVRETAAHSPYPKLQHPLAIAEVGLEDKLRRLTSYPQKR
jgi:hypothetical protein